MLLLGIILIHITTIMRNSIYFRPTEISTKTSFLSQGFSVPRVLCAIVLLMLIAPAVADACEMCKTAIPTEGDSESAAELSRGFYWSILVMMFSPFVLVGAVGLLVFNAYRQQKKKDHPNSP